MNHKTIRIVVAEDEVFLLKNITKKISSVSPDFEIVGEAYNGKEALSLVESLRPDIVFTDIRMPVMDGLTLAKHLHESYPEIFTVIISGYDDFEYAREALCHRVYDYLLKPLKKEPLKELLIELQKKVNDKYEDSCYAIIQKALNIPFTSTEASSELHNTELSCFMICFGNLHQHLPAEKSVVPDCLHISWEEILSTRSITDFHIFPQQFRNIKLLVIKNPPLPCQAIADILLLSLTRLLPDLPVNICFSQKAVPFGRLYQERLLLKRCLFSSLIIGKSAAFFPEATAASVPPAILPASAASAFQTVIQSGNVKGFSHIMKELLLSWEENQYPQQWIEKVMLQIFVILQQCLYFSEESYEEMKLSIFSILELSSSVSNASNDIIQKLSVCITSAKAVPTEIHSAVEEIDKYIHEHYREPLNIAELAQKYHFNHSYLTRMFKKEKGLSPLRLINELRIHDAKSLLMDSPMSVREISEALGFSDQHYFSRIFKDFTGKTPKEYRLQL